MVEVLAWVHLRVVRRPQLHQPPRFELRWRRQRGAAPNLRVVFADTCTHTAHVTATMTHARALHNATRDDPAKITGSIFDFTSRGRRGSQRLERHGLVAAALALAFGHAGAEALCVAPTTSSSMIAQQASGGQRRTQWRRAATEGSSDGDGGRDGSSLSRKIVRVSWLRRPVFVWRLGAPCSAKERCMCVCVKIRQRATLDF